MERWNGILKIPVSTISSTCHRVAASLAVSPVTETLAVPSANAIFFCGDRVEGTGNAVIDRLSNLQTIAETLVLKFGASCNAWVIEASVFNGPFAVYKGFVQSLTLRGEPNSYSPVGFPASTSTVSILSNALQQIKSMISGKHKQASKVNISEAVDYPKTFILGFSKGGIVVNQLVSELAFSDVESITTQPQVEEQSRFQEEIPIIPQTRESLLGSISEFHYVDVGLNSSGAYLTDGDVIVGMSKHLEQCCRGIRFVFHGTPRQWCDGNRIWIRNEKDTLVQLLQSEAQKSGGRLKVIERFYFADRLPDLQMHFEIIENLNVS